MPLPLPQGAEDSPAKPAPPAARPLGWPRLVLLVVLLNLPLFFQGCQSNKLLFTLGPAVPFAQVEADDPQTWFPATLVTWSWTKLLANVAILFLGLWLTTRVAWTRTVAGSRWFPAILLLVAAMFDLWLVWPDAWEFLVWAPQNHLCSFMLQCVASDESPSETLVWWILLISGRLYYLLLVAGLSLGFVLGRVFLRRYFFVRTGARWQIQLGGLIAAVVILGTAIGMTVRLLMH